MVVRRFMNLDAPSASGYPDGLWSDFLTPSDCFVDTTYFDDTDATDCKLCAANQPHAAANRPEL